MKTRLLLLLFCVTPGVGVFSQILYSSTTEVGSRYNFGSGQRGTPRVAFDDVSVPNALVSGKDSVAISKVNVGIRRTPGAPATDVKIYYTPFDDTSTQLSTWTKIPPVLLGTVSLPANGSSLVTSVVSVGDGFSVLFKMKTDTNAAYAGYHTFFIGTALSNSDAGNGLRFTSGPAINSNSAWIYDADTSTPRYDVKFDNIAATFYIQVFTTSQTLMPVTISSFTGEQKAGFDVLTWSTETEINNKGFELQRSADGLHFTPIAFVDSKAIKGSSSLKLIYQYADEKPLTGSNYYRLKQIDKDGNFTMSAVVLLKNDKPDNLKFANIYPNPAKSVLNVVINSPADQNINIAIIDFAGKVLMQKSKRLTNSLNRLSFDVSHLAPGIYTIKAVAEGNSASVIDRFVKQ